jgi:predicted alpha/beta-fold hydrolase
MRTRRCLTGVSAGRPRTSDFVDVDFRPGRPGEPTLVLFHGLEGSSSSHYAQAFAQAAQALGWAFAVPHFRGCSGELNRAPRAYHSGDHAEIGWMLGPPAQRQGGPVLAVGVSLGGNALLRWAEEPRRAGAFARVRALGRRVGATRSGRSRSGHPPGLNRLIYTRMFLRSMKPKALANWQQHPGLFDGPRMLRARSLIEFDDVFTAPLHGFRDTDDYWARASAKPIWPHPLPALVLNARNDPFVPGASACRPRRRWALRDAVAAGAWRPRVPRRAVSPACRLPEAVVAGWVCTLSVCASGWSPRRSHRCGNMAPWTPSSKPPCASGPMCPHCRGWLALDARGDWYMRDERLSGRRAVPARQGQRDPARQAARASSTATTKPTPKAPGSSRTARSASTWSSRPRRWVLARLRGRRARVRPTPAAWRVHAAAGWTNRGWLYLRPTAVSASCTAWTWCAPPTAIERGDWHRSPCLRAETAGALRLRQRRGPAAPENHNAAG